MAADAQFPVTADVPRLVMAVDVLLRAMAAAIRRRAATGADHHTADRHTVEGRLAEAVRTEAAADMVGNSNLTLDSLPT
jgi:hypothetical protein